MFAFPRFGFAGAERELRRRSWSLPPQSCHRSLRVAPPFRAAGDLASTTRTNRPSSLTRNFRQFRQVPHARFPSMDCRPPFRTPQYRDERIECSAGAFSPASFPSATTLEASLTSCAQDRRAAGIYSTLFCDNFTQHVEYVLDGNPRGAASFAVCANGADFCCSPVELLFAKLSKKKVGTILKLNLDCN